jgi:allantoicase/CubicO group peptidase (beta-lactamase class C family)
MCGNLSFATTLSQRTALNHQEVQELIFQFDKKGILEAASFHGDIGENKKTLDKMASSEQAKVFLEDEKTKAELIENGQIYLKKFGMKFLISAKDKSGTELLEALKERLENSETQELENARKALWDITSKRMTAHPLNHLFEKLQTALQKHHIHGAQITILNGEGNKQDLALGQATTSTWFEMASLSKTVGSAFAIEYFQKKNIPLCTSVDELFEQTSSDFRLHDKRVQINHLMNHSALNMHYVNGVPANKKMPPIREFLTGNTEFHYPPIKVIHTPGEVFQYSGGGFLVLEHLIEALEKKSIFELTRPFLDQMGMKDFSFEQQSLQGIDYAHGFHDQGEPVEGSRKMFPAFAAGSMGTASSMATFLTHLDQAFHRIEGSLTLSHDTAIQMLFGTDKGCVRFMGSKMGLGVFIAEAGPNKFAVHQGANDGFRCIYLYCYNGPDRGKGLVALCNSDLNGVLFNAEVTQIILKELKIQGIDAEKFQMNFQIKNIPQEEIVNIGYKNLVFIAFTPNRPEAITDPGPMDPLSSYNKLVGGKILEVTNELFARAENLISDHLPKFDPELFGAQGKIMDSWETVRHNLAGVDSLIIELNSPSAFSYVLISTKYHTGNYSPVVKLEGQRINSESWEEFLPKTKLAGHAELRIKLPSRTQPFIKVKVSMYPDGGLTRLGLFDVLPDQELKTFSPLESASPLRYAEVVPQTTKPLFINYVPDEKEIQRNASVLKKGESYNLASAALGASILSATDEHYSPAVLVISPFSPINMFDGMESARSRIPHHFEEVIVKLASVTKLNRIEMDFTYFVNNNPLEADVEGLNQGKWINLVPKTNVKAYAGNKVSFNIHSAAPIEQIRVRTYPCGGMNRLKVFAFKDEN